MSNRFDKRKKHDFTRLKETLLPVLIFAVIGVLFFSGLGGIGQTTEEERLTSVQRAISRATVQCYAIEGRYPPSLSYLEENYGVMLDYSKYIIQYDVFATNIMPTILVLPKDFQGGEQDEWMEVVIP